MPINIEEYRQLKNERAVTDTVVGQYMFVQYTQFLSLQTCIGPYLVLVVTVAVPGWKQRPTILRRLRTTKTCCLLTIAFG